MALTEKTIIDKIEVVENNSIQVRTATIIEKNGLELTRTYHRHVVNPTDDISNEDSKVQAIANAIWTKEVIAAYEELQKVILNRVNPSENSVENTTV
jgi:hypothetical protein